ncbi:MAG: hypothetical protein M3463_18510 [Verrucomicrobiota bacterium]|nr:hypothetical protein [Verrucomicrobiota bacterium]
MNLATTPEEQAHWMRQWRQAAVALEAEKAQSLRALTEEQSARHFDALDLPSQLAWRDPRRRDGQGLVEQQRLFQRLERS